MQPYWRLGGIYKVLKSVYNTVWGILYKLVCKSRTFNVETLAIRACTSLVWLAKPCNHENPRFSQTGDDLHSGYIKITGAGMTWYHGACMRNAFCRSNLMRHDMVFKKHPNNLLQRMHEGRGETSEDKLESEREGREDAGQAGATTAETRRLVYKLSLSGLEPFL